MVRQRQHAAKMVLEIVVRLCARPVHRHGQDVVHARPILIRSQHASVRVHIRDDMNSVIHKIGRLTGDGHRGTTTQPIVSITFRTGSVGLHVGYLVTTVPRDYAIIRQSASAAIADGSDALPRVVFLRGIRRYGNCE